MGRGICCGWGRGDSPTAQRLMSGPSSMPSGQAQVYLGEWSVICGAFRHRYSQPPLGRLPMLHVSGALGRKNVLEIMKIRKICYKIKYKTRAGPNAGAQSQIKIKKLCNDSVIGIFGPPCTKSKSNWRPSWRGRMGVVIGVNLDLRFYKLLVDSVRRSLKSQQVKFIQIKINTWKIVSKLDCDELMNSGCQTV